MSNGHHCHSDSSGPSHCAPQKSLDWLLWGSLAIILPSYLLFYLSVPLPYFLQHFVHSNVELMNTMMWGIVLGIFFVGVLSFVPREAVISVIGSPRSKRGILRAAVAGLLLDLCSHGILMVAIKLYERGASYAQVLAFLIASPWNSLSLTLILVALVGLPLTTAFIIFSAVIAIVTGLIIRSLVLAGHLPANPHEVALPDNYQLLPDLKKSFVEAWSQPGFFKKFLLSSLNDSRMVLRWLFFGVVLTASVRLILTPEMYSEYLGPSLSGLGITLFVATLLEVCSEGSTPLAADLVTRAHAPGNAFAFLMTGVSTDYTEIMSLRSATESWKLTLALPLLTIPQVVLLAWFINFYG
ncbi:MAG: permease [Bdellovibrionales bacterium]|nr:permease [Bdellovibrionales bacterium]